MIRSVAQLDLGRQLLDFVVRRPSSVKGTDGHDEQAHDSLHPSLSLSLSFWMLVVASSPLSVRPGLARLDDILGAHKLIMAFS